MKSIFQKFFWAVLFLWVIITLLFVLLVLNKTNGGQNVSQSLIIYLILTLIFGIGLFVLKKAKHWFKD